MSDPAFTRLLNKQGTIYRPSSGAANEFGERRTGSSAIATVPIAFQAVRESFTIVRAGQNYAVNRKVFMDITDIQAGDYLDVDGVRYLVVGVEDESGLGHHLRVFLTDQ